MGLNLSNSRIAYELDPDTSNVQQMTEQLRQGVVARKPERKLSEQVECDELYVVAGHKGESKLARKKGVKVEVTVWKGLVGKGLLRKRNHPYLGWLNLGRQVADSNVGERKANKYFLSDYLDDFMAGILVYTDEYDIYNRLSVVVQAWSDSYRFWQ